MPANAKANGGKKRRRKARVRARCNARSLRRVNLALPKIAKASKIAIKPRHGAWLQRRQQRPMPSQALAASAVTSSSALGPKKSLFVRLFANFVDLMHKLAFLFLLFSLLLFPFRDSSAAAAARDFFATKADFPVFSDGEASRNF